MVDGNFDRCHSFASGGFLVIGRLSAYTEEGGKPMTYTVASLAIAFVVSSFCYWLMLPLMH
ncbi:hypothetical protein SynA1560_02229 [Synechococcus sp. A15-60]|nr:hypothetical protein SynA1560_02229 [Synechococcus sp. A15-60]